MGLLAQMIEGDRLELRQGGVPKEAKQQRHQHQPQIRIARRVDAGKAQRRGQTGPANHSHPPAGAVGQPAPQRRRDQFGGLRNRHQFPDARRAESQGQQIRSPIRQQHAQASEVDEIKTGQA